MKIFPCRRGVETRLRDYGEFRDSFGRSQAKRSLWLTWSAFSVAPLDEVGATAADVGVMQALLVRSHIEKGIR